MNIKADLGPQQDLLRANGGRRKPQVYFRQKAEKKGGVGERGKRPHCVRKKKAGKRGGSQKSKRSGRGPSGRAPQQQNLTGVTKAEKISWFEEKEPETEQWERRGAVKTRHPPEPKSPLKPGTGKRVG